MALRKEAASENEKKYVDYAECVKHFFTTSTTRPDAILVLQCLLQQYVSNAGTPIAYIPMFPRSFSHTEDAKALLLKFNGKDPLPAILQTLGEKFSHSYQDSPSSDSSKMLSVFFALYPEHISCLTMQGARDNAKKAALTCTGKTAFDEWLKDFPEKHISGKCSDNYQMLAQIAEVIPKTAVPAYARFLLNQLATNGKFPDEPNEESAKRIEPFSGIYAGWVCVTLGKLADRMETSLKQEVGELLLKRLETKTRHNIQDIGVCFALSMLATSAEIKNKTAEHLHDFLASHLKNQELGTDLTCEFTSDLKMVTSYMSLLFQAMRNLGDIAKNKSKEKIFDILLNKNYLYPYREGIVILFEWMDEHNLKKLLGLLSSADSTNTKTHPCFDDLVTVLLPLIQKHVKPTGESATLIRHYHTRCTTIIAELANPYASTPWRRYLQLVVAHSDWQKSAGAFLRQLNTFFTTALTTFPGTPREPLIHEILLALPLCLRGMTSIERDAVQKSITSALLPPKNTKLDMNLHALQALLKMKTDLSVQEFDSYFNILLKLLKEQLARLRLHKDNKADMPNIGLIKEMLNEVLATAKYSLPETKLPSLLAFLETLGQTGDVQIDEQLQVSIGTIAKIYPPKINEYLKNIAPLVQSNTTRPTK